jgi:hypothetical protein
VSFAEGHVASQKPSLLSASLLHAVRNTKGAAFTNNISRSFGNPTNKTLLRAVRHSWIGIPGIPPFPLSSLRSPPSALGPVLRSESLPPAPTLDCAVTRTTSWKDWAASDLSGRFPVRSRDGMGHKLVAVCEGYTHTNTAKGIGKRKRVSPHSEPCWISLQTARPRHHKYYTITANGSSATPLGIFSSSPSVSCCVAKFSPPNNRRADPTERCSRYIYIYIIYQSPSFELDPRGILYMFL